MGYVSRRVFFYAKMMLKVVWMDDFNSAYEGLL